MNTLSTLPGWGAAILAPLLIWQGRAVKRNTPRFPEAPGPRAGIRGKGGERFSILIVGDSAAAGVGVDSQDESLAGQILACFDGVLPVRWQLIARSGLTTAGMIEMLRPLAGTRFDVAVTSLGVNDVKANVEPRVWLESQKRLVALIREKFRVRHIVLSEVPPMEKFPALSWPLSAYLGRKAEELNRRLRRWAQGEPDIACMPFDLPFDPSLMARDGFHPGPELHRIWAGLVMDRIRASGLLPAQTARPNPGPLVRDGAWAVKGP